MAEERKIPERDLSPGEQSEEEDYRNWTAGQRVAHVWTLTVKAWADKGIDITNQRLRKDVVRIIRLKDK